MAQGWQAATVIAVRVALLIFLTASPSLRRLQGMQMLVTFSAGADTGNPTRGRQLSGGSNVMTTDEARLPVERIPLVRRQQAGRSARSPQKSGRRQPRVRNDENGQQV